MRRRERGKAKKKSNCTELIENIKCLFNKLSITSYYDFLRTFKSPRHLLHVNFSKGHTHTHFLVISFYIYYATRSYNDFIWFSNGDDFKLKKNS